MARDYKRAATPQANERAPGSWLSFVTGLGIGLVAAIVAYWWMQSGGGRPPPAPPPVEQPAATSAPEPSPQEAPEAPTSPTVEDEQLSLPKFDFYKILPEIEVKVPEAEIARPATDEDSGTESAPAPESGATYILQVASFQDFNDADQAKAQLALQGVQATIQRVVINGQDVWHRVHVGPFSNLADVQKMRTRLSQLGVTAIVLKLGGGQ